MSRIATITSKDNPRIKLLRKLGQKKYRESYGLFLVENLKIIEDCGVNPEAVFAVDKNILEKINIVDKFLINKIINKSVSSLDSPSGVIALYQKQEFKIDFKKNIVYLNGINNPGNLGTILRSALAFGFQNIVLDESSADLYNPKTISAAKDAIFKLNFIYDNNGKVLSSIKKKMKLYSTNLESGKSPESIKAKKFCLVLGNEFHGVDKKILKQSDELIKIEMKGEIESLNVASAAAILFYILK